jgi:hypothetical protein
MELNGHTTQEIAKEMGGRQEMFQHCRHPDDRKGDPEFNETCCWCGKEMTIAKMEVSGHGKYITWLWDAVRNTPNEEPCPEKVTMAEGGLGVLAAKLSKQTYYI